MNHHKFELVRSHIERCLYESGVFSREVGGGSLIDSAIVTRESRKWLAMCAGVDAGIAGDCLDTPSKRDRAVSELKVVPVGTATVFLVIRPIDRLEDGDPRHVVTNFANDVNMVEIRAGRIRIDTPIANPVFEVRWEFDPGNGYGHPQEPWLRSWKTTLGCNPAHAPSHMHLNSLPRETVGRRMKDAVISPDPLRLAVGLPNPLLLLLSISNWLRGMSACN